ncbi:MAG: ATP-binding protein [Candidatus Heteroscillospira sp.]|jgi:DNA replication protein DnaC
MDGKLLAQAREELAQIKQHNTDEATRRRAEVYRRAPRVRLMDKRLKEIMVEVFGAAMGQGGDIKALEQESLSLQAQRAEMLTAMGFGPDYLDELVSCPKCRDSGYVMGHMCSCLQELYDRQVAQSLSSLMLMGDERFENFDLSLYDDALNYKTGVSPRQCMAAVFNFCKTYAEHFAPGGINLLLRGGPGLGKTFLSACIARVVAGKGYSVVYESAGDAFEAFEEKKFSRYEDCDAAARVERMLTCDLLILDDLGTEMPGGFASGALYAILNKRISTKGSMIMSTNLSPEELRRRYTPQIASRIEGEFEALEFFGRDIRAVKKERGM